MQVALQDLLHEEKERRIAEKIQQGQRIDADEGLALYDLPLGILSLLAENFSKKLHGDKVFYIRNFHLEPTNICSYHCRFCSYSRSSGEDGAWELTTEDLEKKILESDPLAREIHITGGAHPERDLNYYCELLATVKRLRPALHIKAFSAVEIHHMSQHSGRSHREILEALKQSGLDSLPGGGAEIFDEALRKQICPEKATAEEWLDVHQTAHRMGIPSNATMLYGHLETREHRIAHLSMLRELQDITGGFNAFIPLKFRNKNNELSQLSETGIVEDMRNYAVSRLFLDNFPHLKSYWPMLGKQNASLSLHFGVDDLDGTIADTTSIYSMAGMKDPAVLSSEELSNLIIKEGKCPVERDSLYRSIEKTSG